MFHAQPRSAAAWRGRWCSTALVIAAAARPTAASTDITAQLTVDGGGDNVALDGGSYSVTTAAGGTINYSGVLSGTGTVEVTGTGTLALYNVSTYTLPTVTETVSGSYINQSYGTYEGYAGSGFHGTVYTLNYGPSGSPDPPAVTIDAGATLQLGYNADLKYGNDNATAAVGNVSDAPDYFNLDNVLDNGTLVVQANNTNGITAGQVSGTGEVLLQTGLLTLYNANTFSGPLVIENNMTLYLGTDHATASIPNAKVVFNNGSFILDTPYTGQMTVAQAVFENHYGNDINVDGNGGTVVLGGVYSYADNGSQTAPALANAALNYTLVSGNASRRGINLEGGILQLGDGASTAFAMPGNPYVCYVNLHAGGVLALDYADTGPTYVNTPIAGGGIQTSLGAPGVGTVIFRQGQLVVTQQQYYNGTTQVDAAATLQLGDGTTGDTQFNAAVNSNDTTGFSYQTSGGDGDLLQSGQTVSVTDFSGGSGHSSTSVGTSANQIIDNGAIVVDNTGATLLSNLSGTGRLTQAGSGTTTLGPSISYAGATLVAGGTLAVASGGSIAASSGVTVSSAGRASLVAGPYSSANTSVVAVGAPVLDLSQAGSQTVQNLAGDATGTVRLGGNALTVNSTTATTFGGTIADGGIGGGTGGSLVKAGLGTLTLSGAASYTGGTNVSAGTLRVTNAAGSATGTGAVTIGTGGTLGGGGTIGNTAGPVTVGSGGTITPGTTAAAATLTTQAQAWAGGGQFTANFVTTSGTTANDQLVMSGLTITATGGSAAQQFSVVALGAGVRLAHGATVLLATDSNAGGTATTNPFTAALAARDLVLNASATTVLPAVGDTLSLQARSDVTGGYELYLDDVSAPEPTSLALLAAVSGPFVAGRRRPAG
jgi:autotransporter-associated beta strand protein